MRRQRLTENQLRKLENLQKEYNISEKNRQKRQGEQAFMDEQKPVVERVCSIIKNKLGA